MKPANTNPVTDVAVVGHSQAVALPAQGISIEAAFNAAASKALDKDSLDVMKQLLAMDAERKFNSAFVAMQSELPVIVAESQIPNRGKYQRYEDIMQKDGVAKILSKHGFCVAFEQAYTGNIITVTCILRHAGGHSHATPFSVRVGGKADSETQADCKASTTAKRNALCQALNITIRQDVLMDEENDASLIGNQSDHITAEQVSELQHRIGMLADAVDMAAFWKFTGATKFADIPANKYDQIDIMLRRKEQGGK